MRELSSKSSTESGTQPSPPARVPIGRVLGAHGVRGEIAVQAYGDTLDDMQAGESAHVGALAATVERVRPGNGGARLVQLREVTDRDVAVALRGAELTVPRERLAALPDGEYYGHDLIGLHVQTLANEALGDLVEILDTGGAHDVYRVEGPHGELLLPATREVVRDVDLERGVMTVAPLEPV